MAQFRNVRLSDVKVQIVEYQNTRSSTEIACRAFKISIAKVSEIVARSKYHRLRGKLADQLINESRLSHCYQRRQVQLVDRVDLPQATVRVSRRPPRSRKRPAFRIDVVVAAGRLTRDRPALDPAPDHQVSCWHGEYVRGARSPAVLTSARITPRPPPIQEDAHPDSCPWYHD